MSEIKYKTGKPRDFTDAEKRAFVELLKKQNKVQNPNIEKINRCRILSACFIGEEMVSIGAIKPKTNSDFNKDKANMQVLRDDFDWELGYCYTHDDHRRKGYTSTIVNELLHESKGTNLIASTELDEKNSMVGILEKNDFMRKGNTWKSAIHGGDLGLFTKTEK